MDIDGTRRGDLDTGKRRWEHARVKADSVRSILVRPGLRVLVRGWLHSNCLLATGGAPALIDTGYHTGAADLAAWVADTLGDPALDEILLTHTHSDHAGGVAALSGPTGARVRAPTAALEPVDRWDERALWLEGSGQQLPRFRVDASYAHGDTIEAGGRQWRVVETPGHMECAVALLCEADGVLVTGDALWERGFGP